jgi:hypothetical protein
LVTNIPFTSLFYKCKSLESLDVDDSILTACNLVDLALKIGEKPDGRALDADKDDLGLIRDFLAAELARFEREPLAEGSTEDGLDELQYRQRLLRPLKRLRSRVDAVLSAGTDARDDALMQLSEESATVRSESSERLRLFELHYPGLRDARPKPSCHGFIGPEDAMRRLQAMRQK